MERRTAPEARVIQTNLSEKKVNIRYGLHDITIETGNRRFSENIRPHPLGMCQVFKVEGEEVFFSNLKDAEMEARLQLATQIEKAKKAIIVYS